MPRHCVEYMRRGDRERDPARGLGLGLVNRKAVVEMSKGPANRIPYRINFPDYATLERIQKILLESYSATSPQRHPTAYCTNNPKNQTVHNVPIFQECGNEIK